MIKTFADLELDPILLEAIEEMGFSRPTQVQAEAIPQALDGRDVLASAPTGTGKTAAFVIPALQYLLDFPRRKAGPARILILTPTRELAMQVAEQAQALAKKHFHHYRWCSVPRARRYSGHDSRYRGRHTRTSAGIH